MKPVCTYLPGYLLSCDNTRQHTSPPPAVFTTTSLLVQKHKLSSPVPFILPFRRPLFLLFLILSHLPRPPADYLTPPYQSLSPTLLSLPANHTMYAQPQPPVRRMSTQSIHSTHSTHSTHSSPQTSPPGTAIGYQHIVVPCRQLHPPKSPLYRPAVLRAIDHVSRPNTASSSPSTSPKSMNSDMFGDLKREAGFEDEFEDAIGDDICEEEDAGRVTGPPKRAHWKVFKNRFVLCYSLSSGLYVNLDGLTSHCTPLACLYCTT